MEQNVLTLDLGSAYSKLAARRGLSEDAILLTNLPYAPRESSFLVPSVVARLVGGEILIGWPAWRQARSSGVKLWRNWKASLVLGREVNGISPEEAAEVARLYLEGVRSLLQAHAGDLASLPLRVCVPALGRTHTSEGAVAEIAKNAGWALAENPEVSEPESNLFGVLSRGRNVVQYGYPQPSRMFERALHGALRVLLDGPRSHYGYLVIDIGAFTTDFGYVQVDRSYWDARSTPPFRVLQRSVELGVHQLDRAVLDSLPGNARDAIAGTSLDQWEALKAKLYAGISVSLPVAGGGSILIGAGDEAAAVASEVKAFSNAILQACMQFSNDQGIQSVHASILTGGGISIPGVREALAESATRGGAILFDLLDPDEPLRYSARHEGGSHQAANARAQENLQLIRGGSAIGGCSVFVDWTR